jgi:hypothetical protein
MTNKFKMTVTHSVVAAALLLWLPSAAWPQDSFDDLKKFHDQFDFEGLRKQGEELSKQAQAGQLGTMVYLERGASLSQKFAPDGRLSEVSLKAAAVEGSTTKTDLEAGYPAGAALEIEVKLSVAKGSYKVEFKNQGQVSLTLEAKDGSSAEGKALASVDAQGKLPYEVTANKAENMAMEIQVKMPGSQAP